MPPGVSSNAMRGRVDQVTPQNGHGRLPQVKRTDLIFFCSPNNPTGAAATRQQLEVLPHRFPSISIYFHLSPSISIYFHLYSSICIHPPPWPCPASRHCLVLGDPTNHGWTRADDTAGCNSLQLSDMTASQPRN